MYLALVSVICKNKEVSTGIGSDSAEAVANSVKELCALLGLSLSCCVGESLILADSKVGSVKLQK